MAIIKEGEIVAVEKISTLQENNYKKFKIHTRAALDANYFNLAGVSNLVVNNDTVSFLFRGNLNSVMKKISDVEIANVWIDEPDLEEIFMHYYVKEA